MNHFLLQLTNSFLVALEAKRFTGDKIPLIQHARISFMSELQATKQSSCNGTVAHTVSIFKQQQKIMTPPIRYKLQNFPFISFFPGILGYNLFSIYKEKQT